MAASTPHRESVEVRLEGKEEALRARLEQIDRVRANIAFTKESRHRKIQWFQNNLALHEEYSLRKFGDADYAAAWMKSLYRDGVRAGYPDNVLPIVSALGERGDPLCRELMLALEEGRLPVLLSAATVIRGLVYRSMTEQEYWDYVTGKEPVGTHYKEGPVFLHGTREEG